MDPSGRAKFGFRIPTENPKSLRQTKLPRSYVKIENDKLELLKLPMRSYIIELVPAQERPT